MAGDGKIYITISDKRFGHNVVEADAQNQLDKQTTSKEDNVDSYIRHRFFNMIESQAKQAVNYTISNIGNFTGDYVTQQYMSDAVQALNFITELGVAAYSGAKMTGSWIGAVVAVGISTINKGVSTGQQYYAGYVANARQNRSIDQLRTRAGLNSTNNGNRGTEY